MDLIFICINLCHTAISVTCSFEVDSWERFDLLALLYVMFSCVFVTFQYGVLGQVGYLIVSICDLFFLLWFLSKELFALLHEFVCKMYAPHTSLCIVSDFRYQLLRVKKKRCRF